MSPDEVIQRLKTMGINSSRATLLRYKEAGLIPKPEEGAGGRGVGRFTDYPPETVSEYFASYHVIKGKHASPEQAVAARKAVMDLTGYGFDGQTFDLCRAMLQKAYKGKDGKYPTLKDLLSFAEELDDDSDFAGITMLQSFYEVQTTKHAINWWELQQIARGEIDSEYVQFCDRVSWEPHESCRHGSDRINKKIDKLSALLAGLIKDLDALTALRDGYEYDQTEADPGALIPLGRWITLSKLYPDLQLTVRNAMLVNYRNVTPRILDLLTTGKLPEV